MATTIETGERDFLQNVPPNIVEFHDEKQSTVIRWKINGVPQSKIIETNLDHLNGGHLIIDEIFDSFPTFVRGLDKTIVHQEFHLHDDPEMITDDYSAGNKDAKTTRYRRWESERIAFALLTSKENIPDKNLRQKIRILYKRYNDYRPDRWKLPEYLDRKPKVWEIPLSETDVEAAKNDRESILVHFVDKIQASRFGLENVFEGNGDNGARAVAGILEYAVPLFRATPAAGQRECIQLVIQELERFRMRGFTEIASKGKSDFLRTVSNIT